MNMCVLFFLILGVGQHSISVLGILQMDNLQLDLRNELDVMTKDVVSKRFVEDNGYHAYVFHSGIGNREELKVTSFTKNDAFRISHGVEKWQTIASNSNVYMLGCTPQSIILTIAAQKSSSNKSVGVSTQILELPPNTVATASSMFERWNSSIKAMEVIIVVAINSSTSDLLWFNLNNNNNAEKFWSWPRYKPVSCMVVLTVGRYLHLITINTAEKNYPTTADVYDIALSKQQLDFRLLHSLPLDESSFSVEIAVVDKETYLFIPQTQLGILLVFKYNHPSDSGGHGYFQHNLNITSPGVTRAYSFTTASQSYLAVNGESPNIYRISYSGVFTKELDIYLSKVEDWLIIPVHTYRSEVIILAKHNEDVKLLVWKGVDKGFSEGMMPPCDQTMGNRSSGLEGKFSGAVAVYFYNSPSILLPNYLKHSVLYHVILSLDEVKDPVTSEIFQLEERKIFIQDLWDKQKKIKEDMKGPLSHTLKMNDTNTIKAKWVVESLETPTLMDLGKTTYSKTYPLNSSLTSEDIDLTSLEEKIKNVNEEIYRLKTEVEDVGNSNWDLSNFSGKVLVKGTAFIQNLTLEKLNNKEVHKILYDSLRWDKPKIISGIKKVNNIKAESVNFGKLNNFTATQLSYADGPVVLSGNVTFLERLTVHDFVNLPEEGLVNGIDLSEKVCRVNKKCPVTLTFENLTVQNSLISRTINDESVEINSEEEPSEWSKVFAGNNVTVTYINGNNWTDILKRVVYTDRDAFIPETTVVKGTVFSESDIAVRKLIVLSTPSLYIPQFRESENVAEDIDITTLIEQFKNRQKIKKPNVGQQESSNSPAAAIRNQEIGMQSLLKDTFIDADVIFINVEVLDKVSANEDLDSNSWADSMADVILINETEPEVSGTKSFSDTLDIKKDLKVEGLVGGVNLSRVLTINTDQILDGVTTFHGNITFGNMALSGTWDGVNVTTLDMESVKLSTDHVLPSLQLVFNESSMNIDVQNLTITHLINNMSVNDIITPEEIKEGLKFNSLSAKKLTVLGNINVTGKVCGWNLNEFDEQRFSLTQDQNITGNFNFEEMNVTDLFEVQNINGLNILDLNRAFNNFVLSNNYSDIVISELYIDGDITTSEGVAGYDLKAIAKDAILLTGNNNIKADVVFKDLLTCEMLDVHDTVGGQNWTWFTQDVVYRDETYVVFEGKKTFESGFHVTGDLEVEEVNGHRVKDILTTSTEQDITGEVRILGDLVVEKETNLLGTLNERNISQLASRCYLPQETDSIVCTGDTNFDSDVHVNDLFFEKLMNDINFNEYVKSIVFKNTSSVVSGRKIFTGDVTFSDLTVSTLNGQDFDKFLEDVVQMESDVEISQHITFVENVTVLENVIIDYNLDAPTILTYNLQDWVDNAVYLDRNMTVTGLKHFTSASSSGNISTHFYGDLDMNGGGIILLKQSQTLTGTLKFDKLTSFSNIPVGHKVNNERLDELFENTLMIDWDQVVKSEIKFLEDIVIEGNLTTIGNVNKKDLKKVITLHTNQTLSGQYVFDCLTVTNMTNTTNLISGINITDWKQRAVMLDSDQEITGTWIIEGAVNFTHSVNDLVTLGNVNLHDRADQIKTQILDVELQMKENLTSLCNNTNILIHEARHQEMSLLYFESSQQIEITPGYYKPHYFQAYGENYLFISKKNCNCNLYKWNNQSLQFSIVFQDDLNYFTQWVNVQHDKSIYVISLSDHSNSCLYYEGVNLWLFTNNSLEFIMKLQMNAKDLTSVESLQNMFYTLDSTKVKQWLLKDDEKGMISVSTTQEWIISTTNEIRFLDSRSGLGLVITNGSHLTPLLSSVTLPDNLLHHFSKEISTNFNNHGFLAVTSWEDSEVERRSDFVKIYKSNGILYDKLLTKRPSQLNWFSLQETIWLAFIENSAILQVYQHQGVLRGFQQKLSTNLQSSGLISISLPIEGKWNAHPYLLLFSDTLVQLIESKIVGDPYVGPDLSCYFNKSMNRLRR